MIATELGLHFRKDGAYWRCVELPRLVMIGDGRWLVSGGNAPIYTDARQAISAAREHNPDADGVCRYCGWDGAEWWHLERLKPASERQEAPSCASLRPKQ